MDKLSYALGLGIGRQLSQMGAENLNIDDFAQAIKDILEGDELKGKCGLYAQVTIEKGCSLGYHEHHGETETYYILKGEGEYDDNGVKRPVKAGDITITPDGKGHGLTNTGDTDLVFMALIIFD